jgi:hypothetical protein
MYPEKAVARQRISVAVERSVVQQLPSASTKAKAWREIWNFSQIKKWGIARLK